MEVDRVKFWGRLLPILTAISEAHFVSFDLELSGVASKNPGGRARLQTLQERYTETKEAAERYTILQIGITCAYQDLTNDSYVLRPYNFNLNPSFDEKLDLERIFSFQSGAVDFLLSHGFQLDLPFTHGVPYLSRDEARLAKVIGEERLNRANTTEDVQLKETELQSLAFVASAREQIKEWIETRRPNRDYMMISSGFINGMPESGANYELTGFERRLVHQLVRSEFKDYTTITRQGGIKIIPTDPVREEEFRNGRRRFLREKISRQTGFRWIIEALAGGSLDKLDVRDMAVDPDTGVSCAADLGKMNSGLKEVKHSLQSRRPVVVGHNMFTDVVYLYKTFIGPLPELVEDFAAGLHRVFPNIVDTKWLATQADSDIPSQSSLEQTEEKLRDATIPHIEIDPKHTKYVDRVQFHEAGYDAYLTARVMILLSAKLEAAGTYLTSANPLSDSDAYETAPEDQGGVPLISPPPLTPIKELESYSEAEVDVRELPSATQGVSLAGKKKKKKSKKKTETSTASSSFATNNIYAALNALSLGSSPPKPSQPLISPPSANAHQPSHPEQSSAPTTKPPISSYIQNGTTYFVSGPGPANNPLPDPSKSIFGQRTKGTGTKAQQKKNEQLRKIGQPAPLMPPYENDFWRVYGNKLRVYGTEEQVLGLSGDE